jgi:CheY-like chemotaxis protein
MRKLGQIDVPRFGQWPHMAMPGQGQRRWSERLVTASSDPMNGFDRSRVQKNVQAGAHIESDPRPRQDVAKTLLLIDSVRLTRECLSHLLQSQLPEFEIAGFANENDARDFMTLRPDVVLLNIRSTRISDPALKEHISAVVAATHRSPILLLSDNIEAGEVNQAAEAGLAGVFPSDCGAPLLIAAIHLVVAGGQFYAPKVSPLQMGQLRLDNGVIRR